MPDAGRRRIRLAVAGGVCVPLAYDPWGWAALLPLSIWCLARAVEGIPWRRALKIGWIYGVVAEGLCFCWLGTAVERYTGIFVLGEVDSWQAATAGLVAFAVWCPIAALGWGLVGACLTIGPRQGPRYWLWAMLCIGMLECCWPRIFPWTLGSALASQSPTVGWWFLSTFGVEGSSLLMVLLVFLAASHRWPADRSPARFHYSQLPWRWIPLLLWMVMTWIPLPPPQPSDSAAQSRIVSLVHPSIALEMRHGGDSSDRQLALLRMLIERASELDEVDGAGTAVPLVILPEGILPGLWTEKWIRSYFQPWLKCDLVVGFSLVSEEGVANAVAYLETESPEGGGVPLLHKMTIGRKRDLVPFGERIPFRGIIEGLGIEIPLVDMIAGEEPIIIQGKDGGPPLGVTICYEGILAGPIRDLVEGGARWHINITEDGWYGDWLEPAQHLQLQRSRSIEWGIPWLRSVNGGISAAIDPGGRNGRSLQATRRWREGGWGDWSDCARQVTISTAEPAILQLRMGVGPTPTGPWLATSSPWVIGGWLLLLILTILPKMPEKTSSPS